MPQILSFGLVFVVASVIPGMGGWGWGWAESERASQECRNRERRVPRIQQLFSRGALGWFSGKMEDFSHLIY